MADELTIEWLQAFVMATKQCACGQPWFKFLLMDGHRTHYSLKMMQYAVKNNIVLMYTVSQIFNSSSYWHLMYLLTPLQLTHSKAAVEHLRKTRARAT